MVDLWTVLDPKQCCGISASWENKKTCQCSDRHITTNKWYKQIFVLKRIQRYSNIKIFIALHCLAKERDVNISSWYFGRPFLLHNVHLRNAKDTLHNVHQKVCSVWWSSRVGAGLFGKGRTPHHRRCHYTPNKPAALYTTLLLQRWTCAALQNSTFDIVSVDWRHVCASAFCSGLDACWVSCAV